ncbi:hypothetical protein AAFF_G00182250 [Aldrovandia affinis]|uniref:Uncharacterized protein n=1 Tax=Aldrovandia affinis TaxID=143900 RepID=A0AAD7W687_9TELE|nr:hypothetical protein AAFF_G00182250 [Aldrovandia affinis]
MVQNNYGTLQNLELLLISTEMDSHDTDLLQLIHEDITALLGGALFDASNYLPNEQTQNGVGNKKAKKRNNLEALSNVSVKRRACDDLTEDVPSSQEIVDYQTTDSGALFSDVWILDHGNQLQLLRAEETSCMTLTSSASLEQNAPEEASVVNETTRPVTHTILIASDDDDDDSEFNRNQGNAGQSSSNNGPNTGRMR